MSDNSQKDEIKDETHQLQDIEQEELEDDEADAFHLLFHPFDYHHSL